MKKKFKSDFEGSLKLLIKSSLVVFIGVFLSKILGYSFRIIVARFYGPEVYGLFSLGLMVTGFVGAFASLGLSQGILRYIPLYRGKKKNEWIRHILRFSLIVSLVASIFSGVLLYLLSSYISIEIFHNEALIVYLKIFSILIPISIISNLFLSTLRAYEKIGWYSFIANVLQNVLKVVALIVLIAIGINGTATVLSQVVGALAVFFVAYFVTKYTIKEIYGEYHLDNKKELAKEIMSYSWPILLASVIYSLFYWVDSFFIGYFIDARAVGFYNAAVPIALLLTLIPDLFMQLFLPLITKEHGRNRKEMVSQISKQIGKWIFMLNLPIFVLVIVFPGAIINIFFGPEYLVAENALRFLAAGAFFSSIFIISQNLVSVIGKSKLILINTVGATLLNVILNWILVPKYGIDGAAFSTMISSVLLASAFFLESLHYTSIIPLRRKIINISFALIISLSVLLILRSMAGINFVSMVVLGTFFMLMYVGLILLTKSLDEYDRDILKLMSSKINSIYSAYRTPLVTD